jgi:hypothetical protein
MEGLLVRFHGGQWQRCAYSMLEVSLGLYACLRDTATVRFAHLQDGSDMFVGLALQGHCEVASGNHVSHGFRPCSRTTVVLVSTSTGDKFVMCVRLFVEHRMYEQAIRELISYLLYLSLTESRADNVLEIEFYW